MTLYVDRLVYRVPKGSKARTYGDHWCHLWADSEEELHTFAKRIGMKREWFQPSLVLSHYDLLPRRRARAIQAGAVETSIKKYLRRKTNVV